MQPTMNEIIWGIIGFIFFFTDLLIQIIKYLFCLTLGLFFLTALIYCVNYLFPFANTDVKTLLIITIGSISFLGIEKFIKDVHESMAVGAELEKHL